MSLSFEIQRSTAARTDAERAAVLADPGFGVHFTDHMVRISWTKERGWHDAAVLPYGPITLDPSAAVFHYAQEIFEGLKAYRHADGSIWLFRPEKNAARLQTSADRLMLPHLPADDFIEAVRQLVTVDAAWVPEANGEQSLYIRPFMIASEPFLGIRAAEGVTFYVIASPAGRYFGAAGVAGIDIWVTDEWARAGIGGTGAAKCGGNYAASLVAQYEGYEHGCTQVMFIEPAGKDRVEELGGMNIFLISADGDLITPELTGTILDGVTRDSILTVAADLGLTPREERLSASEVLGGIASGRFTEAFCCGTAAVISPIAGFKSHHGEWRLAEQSFTRTLGLRDAILDIQYGRSEDRHGWLRRVV
ncbi:branched-chain amino acid aminotransferase [Propioniciclava soli]|uniref:Branched-chain-amino-acid aminotransferase n=1 Tax=Propioniciclava soli TaxID=2775081 RepID=A0ABZ3CEI8_9ACTN|nr:branched-chain amino acid aminotransferase [Propioniciclava soli]